MSNERDTQFAGFAKLLLKELLDDVLDEYCFIGGRDNYADLNHDLNVCESIIARRAYDLVDHAVCWIAEEMGCDHAITFVPHSDAANCIPGMTEWPDEVEE